MSGWLDESQVLQKFEAVVKKWKELDSACSAPTVPAEMFAEASLALISVFDLISGMGVASSDMKGNATTLKEKGKGNAETLVSLVNAETEGKDAKALAKIAGDGTTAACALLWLSRALNFIGKMLQVLVNDPSKKMSECVYAGYEASLRPHHGMIIRGTFSAAVGMAPSREKFMAKLGPDETVVIAALKEGMPMITELVTSIQSFLVSKDAKSFAA